MSPKHTQVEILWEGEPHQIDAGIAPLLEQIWRAMGNCTLTSCEDFQGRVCLQFHTGVDASRFVTIVAAEAKHESGRAADPIESVWNRIFALRWATDYDMFMQKRAWEYELHPVDFADCDEPPFVVLTAFVRFPQTDYDFVMRALRRHNGPRDGVDEQLSFADAPEDAG